MAIRVSTRLGTRLMRDGFPKEVVVAGTQPALAVARDRHASMAPTG